MSFSTLGLDTPLLQAITTQGYTTPTPIQQEAIPHILQGKDLLAMAQTGTGKTAAFLLPLLQRLTQTNPILKKKQIRVLILAPTRELTTQIEEMLQLYAQHLPYTSAPIFGGVGINPQLAKIRKGVDIIVSTPGRVLDIIQRQGVDFDTLESLILDEADRMLDMGFIQDIRKILKVLPHKRQTLLFSATFSDEIKTLASTLLKRPTHIEVTPKNKTVDTITQTVYLVEKIEKKTLLVQLIKSEKWKQVLVFTQTKYSANQLAKQLELSGISVLALHGSKSQGARKKALESFKQHSIDVLVATDIAARGLDITTLPWVVNYTLPDTPETYLHRIGRTGRARETGHAISLVCKEEYKNLNIIERAIKQKIEKRNLPILKT